MAVEMRFGVFYIRVSLPKEFSGVNFQICVIRNISGEARFRLGEPSDIVAQLSKLIA